MLYLKVLLVVWHVTTEIMLVIIYLLEDKQELSLGGLIRPKRIYNFCLLHACFVCLCHVLVELYYTFEPIWTNLRTQCTQLPAPICLLFLFFRFSDYLKCPKNSGKIILKISVQEASGRTKGGKRGHHQGARRVPSAAPTLGRAGCPPGCPVGPLDAPFAYIYPSGWKPLNRNPFSRNPLCFTAAAVFRSGLPGEAAPAPCRKEIPPWGDHP